MTRRWRLFLILWVVYVMLIQTSAWAIALGALILLPFSVTWGGRA